MEPVTMPKKKVKPVKKKSRLPVAVTIKGSEEWKAWLEEGAEFCLTDVSKLMDVAVANYLKSQGFEKPRPKR
jgi:hypothetical protein